MMLWNRWSLWFFEDHFMVIRTLYTLGDLATSPKPVENSLEFPEFSFWKDVTTPFSLNKGLPPFPFGGGEWPCSASWVFFFFLGGGGSHIPPSKRNASKHKGLRLGFVSEAGSILLHKIPGPKCFIQAELQKCRNLASFKSEKTSSQQTWNFRCFSFFNRKKKRFFFLRRSIRGPWCICGWRWMSFGLWPEMPSCWIKDFSSEKIGRSENS